jgi:hypothetical protein
MKLYQANLVASGQPTASGFDTFPKLYKNNPLVEKPKISEGFLGSDWQWKGTSVFEIEVSEDGIVQSITKIHGRGEIPRSLNDLFFRFDGRRDIRWQVGEAKISDSVRAA